MQKLLGEKYSKPKPNDRYTVQVRINTDLPLGIRTGTMRGSVRSKGGTGIQGAGWNCKPWGRLTFRNSSWDRTNDSDDYGSLLKKTYDSDTRNR